MDNGPYDRLTAFGNQLIDTHLRIREQLDRLRDGGELDADLRTHCLTFCSVLTRHHEAEDAGAFPVLAREYPQLRPVLDELARDHVLVADAMRELTHLLDGPAGDVDVGRQIDTLAALLETHLLYEEKKIVAALNDLRPEPADVAALTRATTLPTGADR
ncbi:MAG TPA: hemerythrin domain-containing protein [Actinophytocola sp.]|nr:hemerythrin domain-containing protein [Actinophytocola sp.]